MIKNTFESDISSVIGAVEQPRQDEASFAAVTTGTYNTFHGACC